MSNGPEIQQSQISSGSVRAPGFIEQPVAGAANAAQAQAFGGAPESFVTSQARNLAGQNLRGDFLNPETNPHLSGVANQIGDQVFNQTQQRFGGAGRSVGGVDATGQFREDLTNQLSPLYAQNFENERGRQQNTLFQSSQFDPLNQLIQRLGPLSSAAGRETYNETYGNTEEKASPLDRALDVIGFF